MVHQELMGLNVKNEILRLVFYLGLFFCIKLQPHLDDMAAIAGYSILRTTTLIIIQHQFFQHQTRNLL